MKRAVAIFGVCICASWPALAAKPERGSTKAHAEAGQRLFDLHEYAEALKEYKAAYLAKPNPALLFNIGECHYRLGQDAQALELLQDFLARAPLSDPNRRQAGGHIREIENRKAASGPAPLPSSPPLVARPAPSPPPPMPPPQAPAMVPTAQVPAAMPTYPPAKPTPAQAPLAYAPPSAPVAAAPAGVDVSTPAAIDPTGGETHFYGTWWFWTGVAVVAVGAAAAILVLNQGGSTEVSGTTIGTRTVF